MIVGVPAEVKEGEHRVALTPDGVRELAQHGHAVLVQRGAGADSARVAPGKGSACGAGACARARAAVRPSFQARAASAAVRG